MNAEQIGKRIKALMEVKSLKRCYLAKELDVNDKIRMYKKSNLKMYKIVHR